MAFKIDKQTLTDLGIFSNSADESVYMIFNRCRTQGGISIMEQMFHNPLSDKEHITGRVEAIKFFEKAGMDFPFNTELFAPAEYYLSDVDVRSQLDIADKTLQRKMNGIIGSDAEFSKIHKGLVAAIEIIDSTLNFLAKAKTMEYGERVLSHFTEMPKEILELVAANKGAKKISFENCVDLDRAFRFKYRDEIMGLLKAIYYIDVYHSVAEVAIDRGFKFANILDTKDNVIKLNGVFHPRLTNAIGNDITIDEKQNMVFLTGANMAGKSTIMKSIAIAIYIAHVGFPVAAQSMDISLRSGMFTTINLPDNINAGYSHFYSEVMRLKKVALEVSQDKNLVIIFDELFRGTNVKDAYDATLEVVEAFSTIKECTFIVSTHIIEAAEVLAQRCNNVQFVYMPTVMENGVPRYTYKIRQGVTEDRHGMVIINNEGIVNILEAAFKN